MKSTVDEIRVRFDNDVERFSNLETGQSATVDAPLVLKLITDVAAAVTPKARHVLDVGCGAGNYTLMLLQKIPGMDCSLLDLSRPMLDRAHQRVSTATRGTVATFQSDIREVDLGEANFDVILAAAVLHHLRIDTEWESVFTKFFRCLRPGGSIWISDLVESSLPVIQDVMWRRYGEYLSDLKGPAYRDSVYAYVAKEDTPSPLLYQLELLRKVGFAQVELLHKNGCFAAFGAIKGPK
jgi:tRNA (cmo5U34)-methyltransferase